MNIRKLALNLLDEYEQGGKYVNLSLASHSADMLSREERSALTALLYTCVERKITYDYYICAISGRGINSLDAHTLNILRLGICQIVDMSSIPDFAAVNETVKLARSAGERSFVNGVLRAAVRQKDSLPMPDVKKNYRRYLSVKYSFPLWIVKLLDSVYGKDDTEKMLNFFNTEKYTDITVNTNKLSVRELSAALVSQGYENTVSRDSSISLRIHRSVNPEHVDGFASGDFFVQDVACAISAEALSPISGETVIDVCACPGGKSFASAILMGNDGRVISFDLHESKLSLISEGARRLGLSCIDVDCRDAREPDSALFGKADKVVCDVPCSGLGVLGKKPDLRYKSEESVAALPELQYSILEQSAKYLKCGGELLYSTCTLNPRENSEVVERFVRENDDYAFVDFNVSGIASDGGMLTLTPHVHNCDGFFMAKIKKIK